MVVHYQVRNPGPSTIYVFENDMLPYQLANDDRTLTILHGVNALPPNILYVFDTDILRLRALRRGESLSGDVVLGGIALRDFSGQHVAPPSLRHGEIRVRCEVGWNATAPIDALHMSLKQMLAWQHLASYGPFTVVLP
jgi:hypothetical protein